jgi:hypothetical protein
MGKIFIFLVFDYAPAVYNRYIYFINEEPKDGFWLPCWHYGWAAQFSLRFGAMHRTVTSSGACGSWFIGVRFVFWE